MRLPLISSALAAACLAAARPAPAQAPAPALAPDTSWVARSAIYQVFVRDFSPAGNFRGVADGLHRIQSAGANVLWLMPIHPIGELERKGSLGSPYAAKDYRAINPAFGGAADFRALVRAVHARGMKLILDFVPNHTAPDHPWVRERPDFYVRDERGEPSVPRDADGKLTDWTDVVQLDYANPRVRREMIATMRFWLEEFGIDGFRMDVAGFLPHDFWREAVPELRAAVPRPILLLAEWGDLEMHRIGFDLTYGWDSYKRVKDVWRGEPASTFVEGELADMRAMPPGGMRLRFTTNHDETAWDEPPITLFGSPAAARAAFVAVALLPGRPLLYNGQEVESPQKLPLFERDPVEWNQRDGARAWAFYGTVLKLARTEPALLGQEFREVRTSAPDDVIAYRRGDLVVLVNARARGVRVAVTDAEVDGARDLLSNRAQRGDTVSLPGHGAVVLKERKSRGAAQRAVHLDRDGVIRWSDDRREVALFGANYVLPTASDYRAAGYLHADRKRMIDEDMAHFARMGWDGLRLTFWGDWEASDSAGNLIANDHLDLQDYLIARARERGIYMLFSPIQLYGSNWPDALHDTTAPGFGRHFGKERMGTDPAALAAQVNYLRQILEHVNPYTGVALKDEPAILFIELVNEPWHHPEDLEGSVRYIDALTEAVRATGCRKPVFYNVSQDFRIAEAIRRSRAQGVTFGWYPTGLNSGRELEGNYLRGVDAFPGMLRQDMARMPRIVYEFDAPDLRQATMYPAMARTFRAVGAQFAVMFAYDMLRTASRNLGWQTHYLNMVYTPRKAVSAIIAAEAMRRLPRMRSYGSYPRNTRFGDFRVSHEGDLAELVARDAFLYAGSTRSAPPDPSTLRRIAGYGSSPIVGYGGEGIYFLDKVRPGLWRLEVYPDAVPVRDPFEPPSPDKIVTRAIRRAWPMTVGLPDLGETYTVQPIAEGNSRTERAEGGRVTVTPGVYVLSARGPVDVATLPKRLGHLGFAEYHPPPLDTVPPSVLPLFPASAPAGRDAELRARVVDATPPDSAVLFVRAKAEPSYRGYGMRRVGAYEYAAMVPANDLREGPHELTVTVFRGDTGITFPGGVRRKPIDWNYSGVAPWTLDLVGDRTPLRLFDPGSDAELLSFTRIGDAGRRGLFRVELSDVTGRPVFHLPLPVDTGGWSPPDYTASLVVARRIEARRQAIAGAKAVRGRLRGLGPRQVLHLTLMEDDGTSWTAPVTVDSTWSERSVPLSAFTVGRGVLLPQGFPGEWNYWVEPAEGRGGGADRPRLERVERLQLSLRRDGGAVVPAGRHGVEVEWVSLEFGP